jgi:hypothetical protein
LSAQRKLGSLCRPVENLVDLHATKMVQRANYTGTAAIGCAVERSSPVFTLCDRAVLRYIHTATAAD